MLYKINVFILTLISILYSQPAHDTLDSRVTDLYTGEGIAGVEVFTQQEGAITDESGCFSIELISTDTISVRCMGYQSIRIYGRDVGQIIQLKPRILEGQTIQVTSNQVIAGVTPVAYTSMDQAEISLRYHTQDVPMVLSTQTGIHAYSESGNGTGYSYVSIRGFDQSRISVMLDNVPLNDNESHQVYWVDHGDILSNAKNVEIQRGVGSGLYGAAAFGGSININTGIASKNESLSVGALQGSYKTNKYRLQYQSGQRFGPDMSVLVRGSMVNSDGYRVDSQSDQASLMVGISHRNHGLSNEFRATVGKELSVLQWDGVSEEYLQDPELRRQKMSWTVPFTDDYLQQIYSLNTSFLVNEHSVLRNVIYLVRGNGFYEVDKSGQNLYSYNLDVLDMYPDSVEQQMDVAFTRKKWINNNYYGITPVWTYETSRWRSDLGMELRKYSGDHFGEVIDIQDSSLAAMLPNPYKYYNYSGEKNIYSLFGQFLYRVSERLSTTLELRSQIIDWVLDQQAIGHAPGVDLNANWEFLNPRLGFSYEIQPHLRVFAGIGSAQKEPADAQIIEADDVWSEPKVAPTEQVVNYEAGLDWYKRQHAFSLNLYRINYQNELLSDIYDFQESGFALTAADLTIHEGLEIESRSLVFEKLYINANASISRNYYVGGEYEDHLLPNVPSVLANASSTYQFNSQLSAALMLKYVGKQFINAENTDALAIPAYYLLDFMSGLSVGGADITLRVNNLLDEQYATYGYEYYGGYYWPGAGRNFSFGITYRFNP